MRVRGSCWNRLLYLYRCNSNAHNCSLLSVRWEQKNPTRKIVNRENKSLYHQAILFSLHSILLHSYLFCVSIHTVWTMRYVRRLFYCNLLIYHFYFKDFLWLLLLLPSSIIVITFRSKHASLLACNQYMIFKHTTWWFYCQGMKAVCVLRDVLKLFGWSLLGFVGRLRGQFSLKIRQASQPCLNSNSFSLIIY